MTVQDGIVYKAGQVVILLKLRPDILQRLHSSHQGVQSTVRRARDAVYWPGMSKDIEIAVSQCPVCEETSPALPKEKLLVHEILGKPCEKVSMDLYRIKGKDYLIVVDYLTDFFALSEWPDLSASCVVQAAKQQFARHGIPVWVHSDGGSQTITIEFSVFSHAWGFEHTLSSPYNSQSNGKAELAV